MYLLNKPLDESKLSIRPVRAFWLFWGDESSANECFRGLTSCNSFDLDMLGYAFNYLDLKLFDNELNGNLGLDIEDLRSRIAFTRESSACTLPWKLGPMFGFTVEVIIWSAVFNWFFEIVRLRPNEGELNLFCSTGMDIILLGLSTFCTIHLRLSFISGSFWKYGGSPDNSSVLLKLELVGCNLLIKIVWFNIVDIILEVTMLRRRESHFFWFSIFWCTIRG